jgi:hypothetical protein
MSIDQITSFAIERHLDPLMALLSSAGLNFAIRMRNLAEGPSSEKRPRVSFLFKPPQRPNIFRRVLA